MIKVKTKGDLKKLNNYWQRLLRLFNNSILDRYGEMGVEALKEATPKRTGLTSESWKYAIKKNRKNIELYWYNTNIQDGVRVAIVLQLGHATKRGTFVEGRDYITPAIQPVFDDIARRLDKEVKSL